VAVVRGRQISASFLFSREWLSVYNARREEEAGAGRIPKPITFCGRSGTQAMSQQLVE
jgi:hypothetical protein